MVLHLDFDKEGWYAEVTKSQGALGKIFPVNTRLRTFPIKELVTYSKGLTPQNILGKSEEDLAKEIVQGEVQNKHTQPELIKFAAQHAIPAKELGAVLAQAGFKGFEQDKWEAMKEAVVTANLAEVK